MKIILLEKNNSEYQPVASFLEGLGHEVIIEKSENQFENQVKEAEYYYKKDKIVTISIEPINGNREQNVIIYYGYEAYENKVVFDNIEIYKFISDSLYIVDNLMEYNFNILIDRIIDACNSIDITELKNTIGNVDGPCVCIGNGGSYAASVFVSRVLESKNKIITLDKQPRDMLYSDLSMYKNIFAVTYGNRNYGVIKALEKARDNDLNTYVLTNKEKTNDIDNFITYKSNHSKEYSFISIASTFMPMSVMLKYYTSYNNSDLNKLIRKIYNNAKKITINDINKMPIIEIMSGDNTYVASRLLESSIAESGIGIPVVHEKYDYCHGRSNLSYYNKNSILIYLVNGEKTELDSLLIKELTPYYKQIILLDSSEKDRIIGEYDLAMKGIFLCKSIAESQNIDLCTFDYSPVVKTVYRFNKEM